MEGRRLKKEVVYGIYAGVIVFLLGMLYYFDFSNRSFSKQAEPNEDFTYVSKLFDSTVKSVVSTPTPQLVMKPYNNADIKVLKNFYDYKAEEKIQENSIINYDTTYMQNTGIVYGGLNEAFDVVSVLPGKVTSIKDDKLLGKIVTIDHGNGIVSTYQSLSEVTVKENDEVSAGTIIGRSGESNLEKEIGSHLLFEFSIDGKNVNPENYYDKQFNDIKNN